MGYSNQTKTGQSQTRDETYRAQKHGWLADGRSIDLTRRWAGRVAWVVGVGGGGGGGGKAVCFQDIEFSKSVSGLID